LQHEERKKQENFKVRVVTHSVVFEVLHPIRPISAGPGRIRQRRSHISLSVPVQPPQPLKPQLSAGAGPFGGSFLFLVLYALSEAVHFLSAFEYSRFFLILALPYILLVALGLYVRKHFQPR
jgi:hypothetical protein